MPATDCIIQLEYLQRDSAKHESRYNMILVDIILVDIAAFCGSFSLSSRTHRPQRRVPSQPSRMKRRPMCVRACDTDATPPPEFVTTNNNKRWRRFIFQHSRRAASYSCTAVCLSGSLWLRTLAATSPKPGERWSGVIFTVNMRIKSSIGGDDFL